MPTVGDVRDAVAQAAEPLIAKAIGDAMRHAATVLEQSGQIEVGREHEARISAVLFDIWLRAITDAGGLLLNDFKADAGFESKADEDSFFQRVLAVFAEMFGGRKITAISDTTREQVRDIVLNAQLRGETLAQAAKAIRAAIPGATMVRARVIARTEAHGASNYGQQEVAKQSRRPLVKEWISVEDARTRDFGESDGVVDEYSHRALNEVKVPMEEPFAVPDRRGGFAPLMYPGDPNGPAGAVINCRCVVGYVKA